MIEQKNRFHGHASLKYVFAHGELARGKILSVKYIHNPRRRNSRVAVIVSKKVLHDAVLRNRARRRTYEIMRNYIPRLPSSVDIAVVIYSPEILTISSDKLSHQVDQLLSKLNLI